MAERELIFFAYQGRSEERADENVDAIKTAITRFNGHQKHYYVKSWEEYRKTATISGDVLAAIEQCSIFACDLTYLNHNVLFELGYAIGKEKAVLVFLNERITSSKKAYLESFMKTVRYTPLTNADSITTAFQRGHYNSELLKEFVNIENVAATTNTLLYLQSRVQTQASLDLIE